MAFRMNIIFLSPIRDEERLLLLGLGHHPGQQSYILLNDMSQITNEVSRSPESSHNSPAPIIIHLNRRPQCLLQHDLIDFLEMISAIYSVMCRATVILRPNQLRFPKINIAHIIFDRSTTYLSISDWPNTQTAKQFPLPSSTLRSLFFC